MTPAAGSDRLILLTGVTGYVGGRLRAKLEARGLALRCMVRNPATAAVSASARTEVVAGDVLDPAALDAALRGVDTAFYMIHSMAAGADFARVDRRAAENFASAARRAGVRRIVYLGGLGVGDDLSPHLRSRHEVGEILRSSGVPVIELRASIVIGSGSLSFEMVRALVERLPVMITPRWVEVEAQPIAIEDLLVYLSEAVDVPLAESRIVEVGGADRVSYGDLMREYARQRGLSRAMIKVPVLTPRLSSLWLGLVTPLYARVGRALVESIKHSTVVEDPAAAEELFDVRPAGMARAIADALEHEEREPLDVDALTTTVPERAPRAGVRVGNRMVDSRSVRVAAPPARAFAAIARIGGATGWYAHDRLWKLRGWMDKLIGGPGLSLRRRDPETLRIGDHVDCWRVEALDEGRRLLLKAEMKLPGRGRLEFEVLPEGEGARIRQTAVFDPLGLFGLAYWYAVCPFHALVFDGMLKGIAAAAEREEPAWRPA